MDKTPIEHPKVFISYAWGSAEHQSKVMSFVTDLVNNGVDVEFDKFSLKEGHDTIAFMEKCVVDPEITNVLILLDEQYASKADSRSGGVGTETQIISPHIYKQVEQEKFIPIIFERGENGEVFKPTYLEGRLHFDLTQDDNYESEYKRLIKRLYGIEIYKKPELGTQPTWLFSTPTISTKVRNAFSSLKLNQPDQAKTEQFITFLTQLKDKLLNYSYERNLEPLEDYLFVYIEMKNIRDEFLQLISYVSYISNGEEHIINTFEEIKNAVTRKNGLISEIKQSLLHELFIYLIAIYYKQHNYKAICYTLGKTYFDDTYTNKSKNYNMFYFHNENLNNAKNHKDNKKYLSGTVEIWSENINTEFCTFNEFVFADLLCFNYSIYGKEYREEWKWFPMSYIYDNNNVVRAFAIRFQSIEFLTKASQIFGYDNIEEFKIKIAEIEKLNKDGTFREYRYSGSFDSAPIICHYIKADGLGIYK